MFSRYRASRGATSGNASTPQLSPRRRTSSSSSSVQPATQSSDSLPSVGELPANAGQRRSREPEEMPTADNDVAEHLARAKRAKQAKQAMLVQYAGSLSGNQGTHAEALKDFAMLEPECMSINMKWHMVKLENVFKASLLAATLNSMEFRQILNQRLSCCITSPDLKAYVVNMMRKVMRTIKSHPQKFGVPEDIMKHPAVLSQLQSTVSRLLSQIRSTMRTRILASMSTDKGKIPLSTQELATLLAGTPGVTSTKHWARAAYLRQFYIVYAGLPQYKPPPGQDGESLTSGSLDFAVGFAGQEDRSQEDSPPNDDRDTDEPGDTEAPTEEIQVTGVEADENVKRGSLWESIDKDLKSLREWVNQTFDTQARRDSEYTSYFTTLLAIDMKQFPGENATGSEGNTARDHDLEGMEWYEELQNVMHDA